MPNVNNLSNTWDDYDAAYSSLENSLKTLAEKSRQHLARKYGLSDDFRKAVQNDEEAIELCEKAMDSLSTEYIENFSLFRESSEPKMALQYLEQAETIWRAESAIINALDSEGQERAFLKNVRQQSLMILETKLEEISKACTLKPNDQNIALCIGVLALIDHILAEFNHPPSSPQRKKIRNIALNFA